MAGKNQVRCPVGRRAWCPDSLAKGNFRLPRSRRPLAHRLPPGVARMLQITEAWPEVITRLSPSKMTVDLKKVLSIFSHQPRVIAATNSEILGKLNIYFSEHLFFFKTFKFKPFSISLFSNIF